MEYTGNKIKSTAEKPINQRHRRTAEFIIAGWCWGAFQIIRKLLPPVSSIAAKSSFTLFGSDSRFRPADCFLKIYGSCWVYTIQGDQKCITE